MTLNSWNFLCLRTVRRAIGRRSRDVLIELGYFSDNLRHAAPSSIRRGGNHALTSTTVRPWTLPANIRRTTSGTSVRPTTCVVRASLRRSRSRAMPG